MSNYIRLFKKLDSTFCIGGNHITASSTKQLYLFLTACSGNWRNTVHISCQGKTDIGYLLAADRDGQPVILSVQRFYELTGVQIDPAECCGQITEAGFETLYAQYLLWHLPAAEEHPLRKLCEKIEVT